MPESRVQDLNRELNIGDEKNRWLGEVPDDLRDAIVLEAWGYYSSSIDNRKKYPPEQMFLDGGKSILPVLRSDNNGSLRVKAFVGPEGVVIKFKIEDPSSADFIMLSGKFLEDAVNVYFLEKEKGEQ